jgi:hypothetical protein
MIAPWVLTRLLDNHYFVTDPLRHDLQTADRGSHNDCLYSYVLRLSVTLTGPPPIGYWQNRRRGKKEEEILVDCIKRRWPVQAIITLPPSSTCAHHQWVSLIVTTDWFAPYLICFHQESPCKGKRICWWGNLGSGQR